MKGQSKTADKIQNGGYVENGAPEAEKSNLGRVG